VNGLVVITKLHSAGTFHPHSFFLGERSKKMEFGLAAAFAVP
jgi:hypothetical protein